MVPLRADTANSQPAIWLPPRPQLILSEVPAGKIDRSHPIRRAPRRRDNILFSMALASVLLFFVGSVLVSAGRTVAASYASSLTAPVPVKTVRVAPGDTLWKYAARYGDPNAYILDRVEAIARDNRLSSSAPLVPGQVLRVSVRNPAALARMQHAQARLAALPRS